MRTPKKKPVAARTRAASGGAEPRVPILITSGQRRRDRLQQTLASVKTYVESLRPIPEPVPELEVPNFLDAIRKHRQANGHSSAVQTQAVHGPALAPQHPLAVQNPAPISPASPPAQPTNFTSKSKLAQQKDPLRAAFVRPVPADPSDLRPRKPIRAKDKNRRLELAAVAMNTTLLLTAAPVGAALVTYSVLRAPHAATSFRAMALVGVAAALGQQLPILATLVGMA